MNLRQFAADLEKGKVAITPAKAEYPSLSELVQLLRTAADRLEDRRQALERVQDALVDDHGLWEKE
jgi:hypothetical protein